MRAISPGALGSRQAGHVVRSRTGASVGRGTTHDVGNAKMPSLPTSATPTNVASEPGVDTMPVGCAPTVRKLYPGTVGSESETCPRVRSTRATSPRVVCVTIENACRSSPSTRLVSGQSSMFRGWKTGMVAVGFFVPRQSAENAPLASRERSTTGCALWVQPARSTLARASRANDFSRSIISKPSEGCAGRH